MGRLMPTQFSIRNYLRTIFLRLKSAGRPDVAIVSFTKFKVVTCVSQSSTGR
jgi:hypothetical protein